MKKILIVFAIIGLCTVKAEAKPPQTSVEKFKTEFKAAVTTMDENIFFTTSLGNEQKMIRLPAEIEGWICAAQPVKIHDGVAIGNILCHTAGDNAHHIMIGAACPANEETAWINRAALLSLTNSSPKVVDIALACETTKVK